MVPTSTTKTTTKAITLSEVQAHCTRKEFWTVVDGTVYDLSSYVDQHPGGPMIMNAAGADASVLFHTYHIRDPVKAKAVLDKFRIGPLERCKQQEQQQTVEMGDFYRDCAQRVRAALKDTPRHPTMAKVYFFLDAMIMFSMAMLGIYIGYNTMTATMTATATTSTTQPTTIPLWLLVFAHLLAPFHVRCMGQAHANGHAQIFDSRRAQKWAEWLEFVLGYAGIGFGLTSDQQNERKLLLQPRSISQYEFTNGRGFGEHAAIHHVKGTDLDHDECHDLIRAKFLFRTTDDQTYLSFLHAWQTTFWYQCVVDAIGEAIICGKFLQFPEHIHYVVVHLIPQKQYGRAVAILCGLVPCIGYFWCYFGLLLSTINYHDQQPFDAQVLLLFVVLVVMKEYIGYLPGQIFFAQHVWDQSTPEEVSNTDWGRYNAVTSYSFWPDYNRKTKKQKNKTNDKPSTATTTTTATSPGWDMLLQPVIWGWPVSGSLGVGACSGTLSYHLEHTLFPGINYLYLPQIAPIVRQCCHDHKIAYHCLESTAQVIQARQDLLNHHNRPQSQQPSSKKQL